MRNTLSPAGLQSQYKAAVALAESSGKSVQISDGEGLMLVVRASGASWVLRVRVKGQRKDITLGRWPTLSLKDARQLADDARRSTTHGVDVTAVKRAARQEIKAQAAAKADNVRKLYEDWLKLRGSTISDIYRGNIEAAFMKDVLPAIGTKAPHEVTRADCIAILRTVEQRGATVMLRRVRMWLRQMFEFGIDDERRPLLNTLPVPTGHLTSFKQDKRGNYPAITDPVEALELMKRIRRLGKYINRAALLLSARTFQRPTETREAVWEEFDLDAGIWRIAADRMWFETEHWVPLSRQCVEELRALQGVVGDTGLLFPGIKPGKPISEGTLRSQLISMGYEGKHTPHGFRAMARTIIVERLRFNKDFVEKQLSHETDESGLRGAYDRAEYWEDRVKMMQAWSDFLDGSTGRAR